MMYVGWWDKHGNPNMLTSSGISDIGGQVTYNETFVDIEKLHLEKTVNIKIHRFFNI